MQIGLECFLDEQLCSMIASDPRYGNCDIYGKKNCIVYDTEADHYLEQDLENIFDAFTVAKYLKVTGSEEKVDYLTGFLSRWKLFALKNDDLQRVIKAICHNRYQEEPELFDEKVTIREFFSPDAMEQGCILKNNSWDDFCYNIKHVNRFHSQQFNFHQLKKLLVNLVIDIPKGCLMLFRSRICDEDNYDCGYPVKKMGAPPIPFPTAGRTNSDGIQCLYLTNNIETSFHEVRARDNDHVSVGEFSQVRDLKLIDLSILDKIGPFSIPDFDMSWFAINIEIIRKISNEIAKPMRRFDRTLDYIPTQYICDYIKHLGYDGIKYKSTLVKDGINYAIFNEKKFECVNVKVIKICSIDYMWDNV